MFYIPVSLLTSAETGILCRVEYHSGQITKTSFPFEKLIAKSFQVSLSAIGLRECTWSERDSWSLLLLIGDGPACNIPYLQNKAIKFSSVKMNVSTLNGARCLERSVKHWIWTPSCIYCPLLKALEKWSALCIAPESTRLRLTCFNFTKPSPNQKCRLNAKFGPKLPNSDSQVSTGFKFLQSLVS